MRNHPSSTRHSDAGDYWGVPVGVGGVHVLEYPTHEAKRAPPSRWSGGKAGAEPP